MRVPPNRERILGHPVNALSNSEVLALIIERALEGSPGAYVCLTNVATTMLSQRSPQLRAAVEGAYISMPDGMPLVWILRRRGYSATEKLTGADLMPRLAQAGRGRGLRHFLYGWTNRMSQAAGRGLVGAVPGSLVVGTHCPPFAAAQDPGPDDLDVAEATAAPWRPRGCRSAGPSVRHTGTSRNYRPGSRRHVHTFCGLAWVRHCKKNGWRWSRAASTSQ